MRQAGFPSSISAVVILVSLILTVTCCSTDQPPQGTPMSKSDSLTIVELPEPQLRGEQSLEQTLASRRSIREFTDKPLTDAEISQLLWAAQGITDPAGLRTAPSAGALYPLEMYVARSSGLYHFDPARHQLTQRHDQDLRQAIHRAALSQDALIEVPAVFVITAVYARTRAKYGDRAERYVHMEAGHAARICYCMPWPWTWAECPLGHSTKIASARSSDCRITRHALPDCHRSPTIADSTASGARERTVSRDSLPHVERSARGVTADSVDRTKRFALFLLLSADKG